MYLSYVYNACVLLVSQQHICPECGSTSFVCCTCLSNICVLNMSLQRPYVSCVYTFFFNMSATFECLMCLSNICVLNVSLQSFHVSFVFTAFLSCICLYNFCVFHVFQQRLCLICINVRVCVICMYNMCAFHVPSSFLFNVFRSNKCLRLNRIDALKTLLSVHFYFVRFLRKLGLFRTTSVKILIVVFRDNQQAVFRLNAAAGHRHTWLSE
jgi:hypothetical protein